jgi:hypothetical protein
MTAKKKNQALFNNIFQYFSRTNTFCETPFGHGQVPQGNAD